MHTFHTQFSLLPVILYLPINFLLIVYKQRQEICIISLWPMKDRCTCHIHINTVLSQMPRNRIADAAANGDSVHRGAFEQFETKWMSKHRSSHCHNSGMLPLCARRQYATGGFVWILSAVCLPAFISGEAWKIDGLAIDFLTPIFRQTLSASPLSAPSFLSLSQSFASHLLHSIRLIFVPSLYFSRSLAVSIFQTWHVCLLSVRLRMSE